jgi:hypothetical protein
VAEKTDRRARDREMNQHTRCVRVACTNAATSHRTDERRVLNLKIGPDCGKNSTHDLLSSAQSNYSSALLIHSHQTTAASKYHSVNLNLVVGIGFFRSEEEILCITCIRGMLYIIAVGCLGLALFFFSFFFPYLGICHLKCRSILFISAA